MSGEVKADMEQLYCREGAVENRAREGPEIFGGTTGN